jgi:hypothetical protein
MDKEVKPVRRRRFPSRSFLLAFAIIAFIVAWFLVSLVSPYWSQMSFQRHLKSRVTAEELHAWASGVLAPYQGERDPELCVELTNLPPMFQGLDKWPPHAFVYGDSETRFESKEPIPYIKINYGSAAGHFGAVLGPTNLSKPPDIAGDIYYTVWKPGIWFFNSQ